MLEEKVEQQPQKNFFYKKRLLIISLSFILSIALIVLSFFFVIKVNFKELFEQFATAFTLPTHIGWFLLLFAYIFLSFFFNIVTFWIRIRRMNLKIPTSQWILLAMTIGFLKAVTPANFIYDPYTLFWMRSNGISVGRASAIIFINAWEWQVAQLLITLPSFIWIALKTSDVLAIEHGNAAYILLLCGLIVDIAGCFLMTFLCFSTKIHVFLSSVFNWVKKKLHMQYHTKEQIKETYGKKALIQKEYVNSMKQYKDTILIFVMIFMNEFLIYSTVYFSLSFIKTFETPVNWFNYYWTIFNISNVVFTANKLIITPGGEFSIEFMMRIFLKSCGKFQLPETVEEEQFLGHGILIWRTFSIYLPCFVGFFGFCATLIHHLKNNNQQKVVVNQ